MIGCGRIEFDPRSDAGPPPPPSGCVSQIAANGDQVCVTRADQTVWCWGENSDGALGDGTFLDSRIPTRAQIDQVRTIAGGENTVCAIRTDGSLWCWGEGTDGQIGDGGGVDRGVPQEIFPSSMPVDEVRSGQWHTCARLVNGTTWCWGDNSTGNLGRPAGADQLTPIDVTATVGASTALTIGDWFTCAHRANGSASCWGINGLGELGNGTTSNSAQPIQVGVPATITQIAAGCHRHACAVTTTGELYCWGDNSIGQLGDGGAGGFRSTPARVLGVPPARQVTVGADGTCVLTLDGEVWCWGRNMFGESGTGTFTPHYVPTRSLVASEPAVVEIQAGCANMYAQLANGTILGWGGAGRLGTGETQDRSTPAEIPVPCE
jgi:alpha-tubulin suppressor-like RCC1 family protein